MGNCLETDKIEKPGMFFSFKRQSEQCLPLLRKQDLLLKGKLMSN